MDKLKDALTEEVVRWQVARERRAVAHANVRAGNYTDGTPMTQGDRALYHGLTVVSVCILVFIAILVGALIGVAVS